MTVFKGIQVPAAPLLHNTNNTIAIWSKELTRIKCYSLTPQNRINIQNTPKMAQYRNDPASARDPTLTLMRCEVAGGKSRVEPSSAIFFEAELARNELHTHRPSTSLALATPTHRPPGILDVTLLHQHWNGGVIAPLVIKLEGDR